MTRRFEYRHVITFTDTNLMGNVYFTRHVEWQGRCRELFLRTHCPSVLDDLADRLALVTTSTAVDYEQELRAFDEVAVSMWLGDLVQNRILLRFDYHRLDATGRTRVATGRQGVACMVRRGDDLVATDIPPALAAALEAHSGRDAPAQPAAARS